jgi:hypothetical protein
MKYEYEVHTCDKQTAEILTSSSFDTLEEAVFYLNEISPTLEQCEYVEIIKQEVM